MLVRIIVDRAASYAVVRRLAASGSGLRVKRPFVIKGFKSISIGDNFSSFERLRLEAFTRHNGNSYSPRISIGNGVSINTDCHIGCINDISIGNNVLIASRVFISDHSHGEITPPALLTAPGERMLWSKGPVIIEDDVWIGEGVAIMPGVRIGSGAIIGANSVVTKDVPSRSVCAGVPARVLRKL